MTFFEVEQMDEFLQSLERHLDDWLFTRRDMQLMLKELNLIDHKLHAAALPKGFSAVGSTDFSTILEDLQQRTAACRASIQERLMI
jgi:hypothetical protein